MKFSRIIKFLKKRIKQNVFIHFLGEQGDVLLNFQRKYLHRLYSGSIEFMSGPHGLRFTCTDPPFLATVIKFKDINALARLKLSKYSIYNVLNAFLHVSKKIKF